MDDMLGWVALSLGGTTIGVAVLFSLVPLLFQNFALNRIADRDRHLLLDIEANGQTISIDVGRIDKEDIGKIIQAIENVQTARAHGADIR